MAQKGRVSYKLNQKVKDDKFNVDQISQYNLSLQISSELFRVCVTDIETNRCLLIEEYQLSEAKHPSQVIEQLEVIYDEHHVLQAGFWKTIKLSIINKSFSLIPSSLFDKNYLKDYLNINCTPKEREVYYHRQQTTDTVNIFAADRDLIFWFNSKYPHKAIKLFHYTSPFIEGVMIDQPSREDRGMYVIAEKNHLTILVKRNKKMEFCNTFNYKTPEDFLYFVMFVFDQLKLNPEVTPITIWGEVTPESPIYKKLYKYIRNISFGNRPSSLKFGYQFDEVFDHKFYDLFNMHVCE